MLSVAEALEVVLACCKSPPPIEAPLDESLGLVLAEDAASDVDSPPHDKAMVDGYAVVASDLASGIATLTVGEEVTAGRVPTMPVEPGRATRIMTGAPLPDEADAVVMVERTEMLADGRVTIREPARAGQNIMRRGTSLRRGQIVVPAGTRLRSIEIGALAEIGQARLQVIPSPTVAVIATGDELVPPEVTPGAAQIRNSNSPMLVAAARQVGATPRDLGIARDERGAIETAIAAGLSADVLILSGGVSAGVLDLVPEILRQLGVREVFHRVHMKPGKPLWFGVREQGIGGAKRRCLVFGLPGNPVGSLVCFHVFVRAALEKLSGRSKADWTWPRRAELTTEFTHRGDRPTFYPASMEATPTGYRVTPIPWQGSADLAALVRANSLICFPAIERTFAVGEVVEVLPLESAAV
jgi:molybdopterin molybdotransferase